MKNAPTPETESPEAASPDAETRQLLKALWAAQAARQLDSLKALCQDMASAGCSLSESVLKKWRRGDVGRLQSASREQICLYLDFVDRQRGEHDAAYAPPLSPHRVSNPIRNTPELRGAISAKAAGLDLRTLTRAAGYDRPDVIAELLAGRRDEWSAPVLRRILAKLDIAFDAPYLKLTHDEVDRLRDISPAVLGERRVPVLTYAHCKDAELTHAIVDGASLEWEGELATVPTDGRPWVVFRCEGESMLPSYRNGDLIHTLPVDTEHLHTVFDEDVVIVYRDDANDLVVVLKHFDQLNGTHIGLSSYNAETGDGLTLRRDQIVYAFVVKRRDRP